jgi:CelD/BcsL family acetyltransferase involved in cellulose biosynthesis
MMPSDPEKTRLHVASALAEHTRAWDRLVEAMPIPSPFLRSWWVGAAATATPCLLLVFRGGELIGGLALESDRRLGVERLRPVGAGPLCPDHLDAVYAPGHERAVAAALRRWLGTGDRLIDLDGVATAPVVAAAMPGRLRTEHVASAPCMELRLDASEQGSATLRRKTTRAERRMRKEAGSCLMERVHDTEEALRQLYRLHAQRWEGSSGFLSGYQRFAAACRAGVAAGEVVFNALHAGDDVVGVMASFEVAGRISYYQSGRDPDRRWRGSGTVLLARVIDDAGRRGLREADLLRGEESYKADFATGHRELWRLRCATGPRSAVALTIDLGLEHGRRLLGRARRRVRSALIPRSKTTSPR